MDRAVKVAQHTEGWTYRSRPCRCAQSQRTEDVPYRGRAWSSFVLLEAKQSADAIVATGCNTNS